MRALHGVDEANGLGVFPVDRAERAWTDVYRVGPRRHRDCTRLSQAGGHAPGARSTRRFTRYVDRWSDVTTPPQVRLHRADGSELRVIDANTVRALTEYRLVEAGVRAGQDARRLRDGRA